MTTNRTLTLAEAVKSGAFPFKIRKLRALVANGELYKRGQYRGQDYILAINLSPSDTKHGRRWTVETDEIQKWIERKAIT